MRKTAIDALELGILLDDVKYNLAADVVCIDDDKHPRARAKAELLRRITRAQKKLAAPQ